MFTHVFLNTSETQKLPKTETQKMQNHANTCKNKSNNAKIKTEMLLTNANTMVRHTTMSFRLFLLLHRREQTIECFKAMPPCFLDSSSGQLLAKFGSDGNARRRSAGGPEQPHLAHLESRLGADARNGAAQRQRLVFCRALWLCRRRRNCHGPARRRRDQST